MKTIACALAVLAFAGGAFAQDMTDYEAVNNLHRNEELAGCYAPDARIPTSWQSGGVNTFVGRSAPVLPGQDLKTKPGDVKGLRVSYRRLACSRKAAGDEIDNDLPGTDRPEDVQKSYYEAFA